MLLAVGAGAVEPWARTSGFSSTSRERSPSLTLRKPHTRSTKSSVMEPRATPNLCATSDPGPFAPPAIAAVAAVTCSRVWICRRLRGTSVSRTMSLSLLLAVTRTCRDSTLRSILD
ncbi:hypothetical protein JOB18_044242 [Solea senegalensis]|uniref:Secreted protein n=1 Tax=Solea senegalensis TaxID=28829 RepID=A0AAV6PMA6_SOLSE|nr:hypothetical protein JOB18_044242 [Solea senegalensis]